MQAAWELQSSGAWGMSSAWPRSSTRLKALGPFTLPSPHHWVAHSSHPAPSSLSSLSAEWPGINLGSQGPQGRRAQMVFLKSVKGGQHGQVGVGLTLKQTKADTPASSIYIPPRLKIIWVGEFWSPSNQNGLEREGRNFWQSGPPWSVEWGMAGQGFYVCLGAVLEFFWTIKLLNLYFSFFSLILFYAGSIHILLVD